MKRIIFMAQRDSDSKRRGGESCVAGAPNGESCTNTQHTRTEGISLHRFPKGEAVRKKWTEFVQRHRQGWQPKSYSVLCSAHFEESCFARNRQIAASLGMNITLNRDAVPTIDAAGKPKTPELSTRDRRYVSSIEIYSSFRDNF